jgi:hypothetical protein
MLKDYIIIIELTTYHIIFWGLTAFLAVVAVALTIFTHPARNGAGCCYLPGLPSER